MDADALEVEGDLQLVTEIWVEPQHGFINVEGTTLSYLHDLKYYQIAREVSGLMSNYTFSIFVLRF